MRKGELGDRWKMGEKKLRGERRVGEMDSKWFLNGSKNFFAKFRIKQPLPNYPPLNTH